MLERLIVGIVLFGGLCGTEMARAATILLLGTVNDTQAVIEVEGSQVAFERNTLTMASSSSALNGSHTGPNQAQSAGRASSLEIAANARFDNREFSPVVNYNRVRGTAFHRLEAQLIGGGPAEVFLDFVLPPGFVEFTSNVELRPDMVTLKSAITAQLGLCMPAGCLIPDSLFSVQTELTGDYYTHSLYNTAFAPGQGLDLSTLNHSNVVVATEDGGFIRRTTWSYPEFHGRVSLGLMSPDQIFEVVYFMDAIIGIDQGFGPVTYAAAAINDPFVLSTDPVQPIGLAFSAVDAASVPEPVTVSLVGTALLLGAVSSKMLRYSSRGRVTKFDNSADRTP